MREGPSLSGEAIMSNRLDIEQRIAAYDYPPVDSFHRRHAFISAALGAIFTLTFAGAALGYVQSHDILGSNRVHVTESNVPMMEHSGHSVLTPSGLINHVALPMHEGSRYWLGAREGYSYTTNCVIPGEMKVTYLKTGESVSDFISPRLSVTVYENESFFNKANHSLVVAQQDHARNSRGDILSFNEKTRNYITVELFASDEIVLVKYPSQQSAKTLLADSMTLHPVSSLNLLG